MFIIQISILESSHTGSDHLPLATTFVWQVLRASDVCVIGLRSDVLMSGSDLKGLRLITPHLLITDVY